MRFLILAALAVMLVSCSGGEKKEGKSAGEIMKNYSDTLASAPEKAKAAVEKSDERTSGTEKMMKELEK
ncbi:MAG: hypothetical protein HY891_05645 [Deltaproteobacteria bacterium]|nr:hypothetical protein [Deltaproteobacteria bacterium]